VGVDTAKEDVFTSFRVKEQGSGYCHFNNTLPPEYYRQVTAEKLVTTKKDFHTTLQWVKISERNEALDCFVYARAAVAVRRPNFRKIARNLFKRTEELRAQREAAAPVPSADCHPEQAQRVEGPAVASSQPAEPVSKPYKLPAHPAKPKPIPLPRRTAPLAAQLRDNWRKSW
jgi:phage terminase large subunit GpA-like protein